MSVAAPPPLDPLPPSIEPPIAPCGAPPPPRAAAVPFLERRLGQCAWPLWDEATPREARMVCGAATVRLTASWCARHARRALIAEENP